jgi:hypothetical protein
MIPIWQCSPDKAGTFGDMFGAVTAIFSSITVLLLIISIIYQKDELKVSIKELELTRGEIIKQTKINKLHQQTARLQRIENSFFNLLQFHHEIRSKIRFIDERSQIWSKFEVKNHKKHFEHDFSIFFEQEGYIIFDPTHINLVRLMYNLYQPHNTNVINYYNTTITVLKYIQESKVGQQKRIFFIETFASLFTPIELALVLFFLRLHTNPDGTIVDRGLTEFAIEQGFFKGLEAHELPNSSFIKLLTL